MDPGMRSAGVRVWIFSDGDRDQAVQARGHVRVRVQTAPGAFLSVVVTDTGEYRIPEQLDPERRLHVIAPGKLRSSRYVDHRGWR